MRQELETDQHARSLISKFHDMDIEVIYEGVETDEDIGFSLDTPVGFLQGFYFGQPGMHTNAAENFSLSHIS